MLTRLEAAVISLLLEGEAEEKKILRQQFEVALISRRELTGVGFFLNFIVPENAPRLPDLRRKTLGGIGATLSGAAHGAGFALFITNGAIDFLEGFTYADPWPENIEEFELFRIGDN